MFNVADALSAADVAALQATARGLVSDADIGTSITHYARGARAYNPAAGSVSSAETATAATAYLSPLSEADARDIPGAEVGDLRCLVSTATLASATADDRVVVGTDRYVVIAVQSGPVDAYLTLTLRRMVS